VTIYPGDASGSEISAQDASLMVKPADIKNAEVMQFSWAGEDWSACDCSSGVGKQTRKLTCVDSYNLAVDSMYCNNDKPATTQSCTDCPKTDTVLVSFMASTGGQLIDIPILSEAVVQAASVVATVKPGFTSANFLNITQEIDGYRTRINVHLLDYSVAEVSSFKTDMDYALSGFAVYVYVGNIEASEIFSVCTSGCNGSPGDCGICLDCSVPGVDCSSAATVSIVISAAFVAMLLV
jgi:hypothetical protein